MRKFDTKVQHLKRKILTEMARLEWSGKLLENLLCMPETIVSGNTPTMRRCVCKERAIVSERLKLAMGGDKNNPNVIEVIDIACDECPSQALAEAALPIGARTSADEAPYPLTKAIKSVSQNLSPAATIAKFIKDSDPEAKVIFIGPCTAKKMEFQKESVRPYIDCALTFEELQALFDSKSVDMAILEPEALDNASYFGRIFARSGGLSEAVAQALKERGINFDLKPIPCDGIEECRAACMKAARNILPANFIEGMACVGGCIGGAGCLTHGEKNRREVDKYGREAMEKKIGDAISVLALSNKP
jgi:hypothetical protein